MKMLFLHGPPASGKLTVAKAILSRVDGKLFDNHVPVDFARYLFDFGTPEFCELVDSVRDLALTRAAASSIPLLILTRCYSEPTGRLAMERFASIVEQAGGQFLPVCLSCNRDVLCARIGLPDRVARNKLSSIEGLDRYFGRSNPAPVPRANCLVIDSGALTPDAAAERLIEHFGLDTQSACRDP